jgi:hypothetical protein
VQEARLSGRSSTDSAAYEALEESELAVGSDAHLDARDLAFHVSFLGVCSKSHLCASAQKQRGRSSGRPLNPVNTTPSSCAPIDKSLLVTRKRKKIYTHLSVDGIGMYKVEQENVEKVLLSDKIRHVSR